MEVSRQALYDYFDRRNNPWKYEQLSVEMQKIHNEDECNDCYGRKRMYMALKLKKEAGEINISIPGEATVRKVMEQIGLIRILSPKIWQSQWRHICLALEVIRDF